MPALTGNKIKDTYLQLLQLTTRLSASLSQVLDGFGSSTPLHLSTGIVRVQGTADNDVPFQSAPLQEIGQISHVNITSGTCTVTVDNGSQFGAGDEVLFQGLSVATWLNTDGIGGGLITLDSVTPTTIVFATGRSDEDEDDTGQVAYSPASAINFEDIFGNVVGTWDGIANFTLLGKRFVVTGATGRFLGPLTGNVTGNLTGNVTGNLTGNVTGNTSGSAGSCTGNAATATKLVPSASANLTSQSGAVASVCTVTPGSDGTYQISGYLTVTAISIDVIQMQVTYTDETNTSRTQNLSSTIATTGATVFNPINIRAKASNAITIKTVLTTGGGTITYDCGGNIQLVN